ncbi:helix-turn-helix domain-containing protein [Nesterenkonia flava]|uniref:XRE family transcriptional regulator n=1 Tax=Nesterenkonia flava TaxID=469799 RepID=A0ABU1FVK5_9MICC|nr:XRE family transcriptional regulator [Nesterenkonia flava]MDR5712696.1 XRE family transcriptional regulator [Nesterenkonia flava]
MKELANLGLRLRAARTGRGWTLESLAHKAGISASTLSRLEAGKRQANLELLLPLTKALGIGVDELLTPVVEDPRVDREAWERDDATFQPLSPESSHVQTYKITFTPRPAYEGPLGTHGGHEWLYVLSGRLRLQLDDREIILHRGEAAEFDTWTPHAMSAVGPENAEIISIFNEAGVKFHTAVQ